MDIYFSINEYVEVPDSDIWAAIEDQVSERIRDEYYSDTETTVIATKAAVKQALVDIFTNLLTPPFADPYERPALNQEDTNPTTNPTTPPPDGPPGNWGTARATALLRKNEADTQP